jgi:spermidine synthase
MKPTILRDQATTLDGRRMTLHEHDGSFLIRIDGVELMSTRQHHSERRLAELACDRLRDRAAPHLLIGGLGLGFTLRAALERLPATAQVTVVELLPAVVEWNRNPMYGLAADALEDPRVDVVVEDVARVIRQRPGSFDAILLDVDNGAAGLTLASNNQLYDANGLAQARTALRPGGCLAVWSAVDDDAFIKLLHRSGFAVTTEKVAAYPGGSSSNWLFVGTR